MEFFNFLLILLCLLVISLGFITSQTISIDRNKIRTYQLENGSIIECSFYTNWFCGKTLEKCNDGKRYECLTNVIEINGGK